MSDVLALPHAPRWDDVFELEIARLDGKGLGVADVRATVGPDTTKTRRFRFLVRQALPGERVVARVVSRHRDEVEAVVQTLLAPSPDRVAPRCAHVGPRDEPEKGCGGCTLQTLDYPAQLAVKREIVRFALAKAGVVDVPVNEPRGAGEVFRYRSKMEFSFGTNRERKLSLGLYPAGWHRDVLRLSECHLVSAFTSRLLPVVRDLCEAEGYEPYFARKDTGFLRLFTVRESPRTGERLVELTTTGAETAMSAAGEVPAGDVARRVADAVLAFAAAEGARVDSIYWTRQVTARGARTHLVSEVLAGAPVYHEELHLPGGRALRFGVHPRAFFQPNPRQAEVLAAEVLARLGDARVVCDLYCGTGTLGLCVAPFVDEVVGVELVADAVENAQANAAANGIENATFLAGDVADVLRSDAFGSWAGRVDAALVDPPRAGLMPKAVEHLVALAPARVVYVSCNPESLGRDMALLAAAGFVADGPVQPVDLFPQTHHIESVVLLRRPA